MTWAVIVTGWIFPLTIRSTTQIWVVTHHQYGQISVLVPLTSFHGEIFISVKKILAVLAAYNSFFFL